MSTQTQLDRIDCQIVTLLSNNARLSNKGLAALVGLAPSSCHARVRRLVGQGVLEGFHAQIDPAALGVGLQAIVSVRMQRHSRSNYERFRDYMVALREVVAVYLVAGESDFLIHVAVADANHLRDFVIDQISTREEVGQFETALIFEHHRAGPFPHYLDVE